MNPCWMMTEREKEKTAVSLKGAVITGAIIDFLLLVLASMIMDGGFMARLTLYLLIGHWLCNIVVLVSKKARQSRNGKNFIRFGLLAVIVVYSLLYFVLFAY